MMTFKLIPTLTLILCIGFLTACTGIGKYPIGSTAITYKTYKAVDRMLMETNIGRNTPILVSTISDVDNMETSTTLGRIISEQIAGRLSQRKYNVTELKIRQSVNIKRGLESASESGEFLLSRDLDAISSEHQASKVIAGTYAVAGKQVMVNLKMIDTTTGKIIGARDYNVAIDSNTSKLIQNSDSPFTFFGSSMAY